MTHTLTAFMQLMDHGIVSWENLSSVFIKKVLDRRPSCRRATGQFRAVALRFFFPPNVPLLPPDCQLCQRQGDGRLHTAGVAGHPGEHGAEQQQPLPAGQTGSHHGEARRSPAGVSSGSKVQVTGVVFFSVRGRGGALGSGLSSRRV